MENTAQEVEDMVIKPIGKGQTATFSQSDDRRDPVTCARLGPSPGGPFTGIYVSRTDVKRTDANGTVGTSDGFMVSAVAMPANAAEADSWNMILDADPDPIDLKAMKFTAQQTGPAPAYFTCHSATIGAS